MQTGHEIGCGKQGKARYGNLSSHMGSPGLACFRLLTMLHMYSVDLGVE